MLHAARTFAWAGLVCACSATALAQPVGVSTDSYTEFLRALVLASRDDTAGARAALERAAALDPKSAAIQAAIAELALGHDDVAGARLAAEAAIALDPTNVAAHRVLGLLDAADVDFGTEAAKASAADRQTLARAIGHFERIVDTPEAATDLTLQYALGRLYIRAGQTDKAIPVLQRVADQADLVEARVLLAEALADRERFDEAIEALKPAVDESLQLAPTLARLYERAGRRKDAADTYGRMVAGRPQDRATRLRWAAALLDTPGKDAGRQAVAALTPLAEASARDTQAWYLLSAAHRLAGDLDAAEAAARHVVGIDPAGTRGPLALARVFEERHAYQQVIATLQPVIDRTTAPEAQRELLPLLTAVANAAQMVGAHDRAVAAMTRATTIAPSDPSVRAALVQTSLGARQFARAASLAAAAEHAFPDDLRFPRLRARALIGAGRAADAVAALEQARSRFAGRSAYWIALADAYAEAKRLRDAERTLDEAATRFPGDTTIPFQRGAMYEKAKRFADAERALRRVIALDGAHADALNYLGYMLAERGERLDEAVGLIARALGLDPGNPSYLDSLGWAEFKKGDLADAERHLQEAASVLVSNSVVQDHFAQLLFETGRYADAAAAWARALEGDREEIDPAAIERRLREARQRAGGK